MDFRMLLPDSQEISQPVRPGSPTGEYTCQIEEKTAMFKRDGKIGSTMTRRYGLITLCAAALMASVLAPAAKAPGDQARRFRDRFR
jgi:hypothetical protein